MHPRVLSQRNSIAIDRMAELAPVVAEKFGIDEQVSTAEAKQHDIKQMMRNEAVAELLAALATYEPDHSEVRAAAEADLLARIEAIEGVGPKTMETIRNGLGLSGSDEE